MVFVTLRRGWSWIRNHFAWVLGGVLFVASALWLWNRYRMRLRSLTDAFDVERMRQGIRDLEVERRVLESRIDARTEEIAEVDRLLYVNKSLILEKLDGDHALVMSPDEVEEAFERLGF